MYYPIVDFFSRTAAQICFEFCVDVPWVDPYYVCYDRGSTPIFHGILGDFAQFLAKS